MELKTISSQINDNVSTLLKNQLGTSIIASTHQLSQPGFNGAPSAVDDTAGPRYKPAAFYTTQEKYFIYENATLFIRYEYCPLISICI